MQKSLNSNSVVYLLIHVVVFLLGLFFVSSSDELLATAGFEGDALNNLSNLGVAIGTSIIATGLVGWVIFFYVRYTKEQEERRLRLESIGLVDAFAGRSVHIKDEYQERFAAARQKIDFYGFGLRALREDFLNEFPMWLSKAKIRVLLIDPSWPNGEFSTADQRDIEENNSIGSIGEDVSMFIKSTLKLKKNFPDSFDVRLYTCLPSVNYCRVDGEIFWGPYIVGEQSRNTPTFLVSQSGPLFTVFSEHFEKMWSDEKLSRPAFKAKGRGKFVSSLDEETTD